MASTRGKSARVKEGLDATGVEATTFDRRIFADPESYEAAEPGFSNRVPDLHRAVDLSQPTILGSLVPAHELAPRYDALITPMPKGRNALYAKPAPTMAHLTPADRRWDPPRYPREWLIRGGDSARRSITSVHLAYYCALFPEPRPPPEPRLVRQRPVPVPLSRYRRPRDHLCGCPSTGPHSLLTRV